MIKKHFHEDEVQLAAAKVFSWVREMVKTETALGLKPPWLPSCADFAEKLLAELRDARQTDPGQ